MNGVMNASSVMNGMLDHVLPDIQLWENSLPQALTEGSMAEPGPQSGCSHGVPQLQRRAYMLPRGRGGAGLMLGLPCVSG